MAEDKYNAFDYYNAEPPREGAALPPEEAAFSAPEDEYNEKVHGTDSVKRTASSLRSVALALAVGSMALSFVISSSKLISKSDVIPAASTVSGTVSSVPGKDNPEPSVTGTSLEPTSAPTPTPTPVPLPTEDLRVRLDSFKAYPLEKGFLGEITFTLSTNSGIDISSISGSVDARLFVYDGYNFKKRKMKYHYENMHKEFSMDTAKAVIGSGPESTENQYVIMVKLPKVSSEDKLSVTLTVSNTLNGKATEDKTVTLKNINTWNEKTDSYTNSMVNISVVKGANKTFTVTVTPNDGKPVTNFKVTNINLFYKTKYFINKDFKVTYEGNKITISFKKPKKAISKGRLSFDVLANYVLTDSNGTTYSGRSYSHKIKSF